MMDGAYPPGVTGDMVDQYFREGKYTEDEDYCCGTCVHFNGTYCTKNWLSERNSAYYKTDEDEKEPEDYCDDYEEDA